MGASSAAAASFRLKAEATQNNYSTSHRSGCPISRARLVRQIAGETRIAEIPPQNTRLHPGQIDGHQRIENMSEGRIDAEAERPRVQFQVVAEEHRHRLAVPFHFANQVVGGIGIGRDDGAEGFVRGPWMLRRDEARERRIEVILLEKSREQGV